MANAYLTLDINTDVKLQRPQWALNLKDTSPKGQLKHLWHFLWPVAFMYSIRPFVYFLAFTPLLLTMCLLFGDDKSWAQFVAVKQVGLLLSTETWPSAWPVKTLFTPQFITFKSLSSLHLGTLVKYNALLIQYISGATATLQILCQESSAKTCPPETEKYFKAYKWHTFTLDLFWSYMQTCFCSNTASVPFWGKHFGALLLNCMWCAFFLKPPHKAESSS